MSLTPRPPVVVLLVLDAVGVPTLDYLFSRADHSFQLQHFARLGLGNLLDNRHHHLVPPQEHEDVHCRALEQQSVTADSTTGHREMVGVIDARSFELFPHGFPPEYIAALEQRIGPVLFNQMCGGDEAIRRNRTDHSRTRHPIVYASMCDPLIQIAGDEAIIPVADLHLMAEEAFKLAQQMGVRLTRSIARPFVATGPNTHKRTGNRHDYVLPLTNDTLIDLLRRNGVHVCSVGKPADLVRTTFTSTIALKDPALLDDFLRQECFVQADSAEQNPFSVQGVRAAIQRARQGNAPTLIFANCVDMDAVFGHTQDVPGGLECLRRLNQMIPLITAELQLGDLLVVTADHGMEHRGNYGYHSREPVPLLVWQHGGLASDLRFGQAPGLTEIGNIIAQYFRVSGYQEQCISHVPADG